MSISWVAPVPLGHAAVVDHEEVDLELVGAGAGDGVVLRPYELHHLHAAALALLGGRHRGLTSNTPCIVVTPCTGLTSLGYVQFQGSWHRGSSQELHSKQSIVFPAARDEYLK